MSLYNKINYLVEAVEDMTRVDHLSKLSGKIKDFNKNLQVYKHTPDWSESGNSSVYRDRSLFPKREKQYHRGLYAGHEKLSALYSIPRDVSWTRHISPKTGKTIVAIEKKDKEYLEKARPILSRWKHTKRSKFELLPNKTEYFSENPGRPSSQSIIHNVPNHIRKHGYHIKYVDSLVKHIKKLDKKDIDFYSFMTPELIQKLSRGSLQ